MLKCLIHCADLSNPTKIPSLAADWSYRIMEENFKQGDKEKELGITVHAMGDREGVSIPKCQVCNVKNAIAVRCVTQLCFFV